MNFVLNTTNLDSAGALVCIKGLAQQLRALGHEARINDWSNYGRYDVAIFMAKDADCAAVRKENPKIIIGVADPKTTTERQAREADFCIVSSIEQREVFMSLNRNQFIYYMIPEFDHYTVKHQTKEIYHIVYHGNKIHLNGSYDGLIPALNELGKKYPIEFDVIYNIKQLGRWTMGRPDPKYCKTNDLQWYPNCYQEYFKTADIGVVQNIMPWKNHWLVKKLGIVSTSLLLESNKDHSIKYKSSANAGRAFIFGYFGIPVVADAVPSLSDVISDGYSGRLVLTAEGWYDALEELINSTKMRSEFGTNFKSSIHKQFTPEESTRRFIEYILSFENRALIVLQTKKPSSLNEHLRQLSFRIQRKVHKPDRT